MKAMLLAAGRGNRMRPLTDKTPKPLLRVANKPIIVHHVLRLAASGIREIIINVSHLAEQIQETLGDGRDYGVVIHYSVELPAALETGGGICQALPLLGPDPFLVISADIWTDYPLHRLPPNPIGLAHLVLVNNPVYHTEGDFYLQDDRLTPAGGKRYTFGNMGIYRPALFQAYTPGCFPLRPVLQDAIEKRQVTGELYTGLWENIGTPEQLMALR